MLPMDTKYNQQFSMSPINQEIVRSYRSLYRYALHAIQYSRPARYTVKILLEGSFRRGNAADFDPRKIDNTLTFLEYAAKEKGLEHRILKSLLHTLWWEPKREAWRNDQPTKVEAMRHEQRQSMLDHFEITIKMLNDSMGMCLPTRLIIKANLPEPDSAASSYILPMVDELD